MSTDVLATIGLTALAVVVLFVVYPFVILPYARSFTDSERSDR